MMPQNAPYHTSILAAYMLLGKEIFPDWPGWPKTAGEAIALTQASRSQAYEMLSRLRQLLPTLLSKPGRPTSPPPSEPALLKVSKSIQEYLMRCPGAAYHGPQRAHYSDGFRRHVVGLVEPGQPGNGLSFAQLAEATSIPLGTLKEWLAESHGPQLSSELPEPDSPRESHRRQIISLYQGWQGTLQAFCQMVREQYRLNYGMTFIGNLLHKAGMRHRKAQRPKQAPWTHDTFRALFPGAQWLGDGTDITVHGIEVGWGEEKFKFNLEVILDVASNALVGFAISDFEDEDVVIRAFQNAVETAVEPPLALSLDNRNSNHTPAVAEALGNTTLLATTLGRGQSKAPLEGAFGLFKQEMPPLSITGQSPREWARSLVVLAFTAWARGRNGKPRKKLGNLSPAQAYQAFQPTPEDIEDARRWNLELQRRQDQMRKTREARADQTKVELLRQQLADLSIEDPKGKMAVDLAYYARDAIVNGLAIFRAKQVRGTVPPGADPGRYLAGIIRNEDEQGELLLTSEFFIKNREQLNDLSLAKLSAEASQLRSSLSPQLQLRAFIDRALEAKWAIDYHFWALKSADALANLPPDRRLEFYRAAARRISTSFNVNRQRKQALLSRLAKAACGD